MLICKTTVKGDIGLQIVRLALYILVRLRIKKILKILKQNLCYVFALS